VRSYGYLWRAGGKQLMGHRPSSLRKNLEVEPLICVF
jgi:hypothetical protein